MRILTVAITLGLLAGSQSASAQEAMPQGPNPKAPPSPPSQTYNAEERDAAAAASQKKADALAAARDRKIRRLSRSICSGC
jgi:hypothetical protein